MKFSPFVLCIFCARSFLPLVVAGLAVSLAGCGPSSDAKSAPTSPPEITSSKAKISERGFTIKGDGLAIDATASAAILPSYSSQPLSVRILGGWVDSAKARRASTETDPAEKKKLAMGSFGTLNMQISAGTAEPGTYQLGPEGKNPQGGTIVIDESKEAGLANAYTSKSGTLTVKSITMDGKKISAIDGAFDGAFGSSAGDTRTFTGEFRYFPKKK